MIGRILVAVLLVFPAALAQRLPSTGGAAGGLLKSDVGQTSGSDGPGSLRAVRSAGGVTIRVPQDYPSIQSAIDVASNGATILVSEGVYFENIRYGGKAIVIASLYLLDGDTSHVVNTIIDGSRSAHPDSGSVVYFVDGEDSTSVLCGLTIRGGTGTIWKEGYTRPRVGGGILSLGSGPRIVRNIITHNRVIGPTAAGGGLAAENLGLHFPLVILEENRFSDNFVGSESAETWGYGGGADLWRVRVRIVRNVFERDTVIGVRRAGGGGMSFGAPDTSRFVRFSGTLQAPFPEGVINQNIFLSNVVKGGSQGGGRCRHVA